MKKLFLTLGVLIVLTFFVVWLAVLSPTARKAHSNVENSQSLENGMSTSEMLKIMGEPKSIKYRADFRDSVFLYQPPFSASSGIEILIQNDSIYKINYYEPT